MKIAALTSNLILLAMFCACSTTPKIVEYKFDTDIGTKKLEEAAYNIPVVQQESSAQFSWVKNSVDWPIIELNIGGHKYFALVDSGSTITAVREDSPILDLASEKIILPKDAGTFYRLKNFNLKPGIAVEGLYVHALTKAVFEPKFSDFPCCDMIIGQDLFQALDISFKKNTSITFSKVGEVMPEPGKPSFKIEKFLRRSVIWTTPIKIDKKTCDKARVDTAGSNDVLAIYGPWYGGKVRPEKVNLEFGGKTSLVKSRFSEEFTGYVGQGICANLGRGQLIGTDELTLSLTRGLGFYLE